MGAFGLLDCPSDNRVPTDRLVESHDMLSVHALAREGLLVPGVEARIGGCCRPTLGAGKAGAGESAGEGINYRALSEGSAIELDGQRVSLDWHPSLWLRVLVCPLCQANRYKLSRVDGVWACRTCHRLDYSSRHRHRTVRGLNRIVWLRRRLGADLTPFTPLPTKPLAARKHWRLVREIRQLEARLLTHARRDVAEVLEKRHGRSS